MKWSGKVLHAWTAVANAHIGAFDVSTIFALASAAVPPKRDGRCEIWVCHTSSVAVNPGLGEKLCSVRGNHYYLLLESKEGDPKKLASLVYSNISFRLAISRRLFWALCSSY